MLNLLDVKKITEEAMQLRPGHTCTVDIPDNVEAIIDADLYNGINGHFPVAFDDDVKWLLRVRQIRHTDPIPEVLDMVTLSEVTTLRTLKAAGIQVPDAWLPPRSPIDPNQSSTFPLISWVRCSVEMID